MCLADGNFQQVPRRWKFSSQKEIFNILRPQQAGCDGSFWQFFRSSIFISPHFGNIALWLDGAVNTSFLLDDTRSVCVSLTDGLVDGLVLSRKPGTRCYCQHPGRNRRRMLSWRLRTTDRDDRWEVGLKPAAKS